MYHVFPAPVFEPASPQRSRLVLLEDAVSNWGRLLCVCCSWRAVTHIAVDGQKKEVEGAYEAVQLRTSANMFTGSHLYYMRLSVSC